MRSCTCAPASRRTAHARMAAFGIACPAFALRWLRSATAVAPILRWGEMRCKRWAKLSLLMR
eukprot:scaffold10548_cov27-Tisochrysis_lutea.AAC.2